MADDAEVTDTDEQTPPYSTEYGDRPGTPRWVKVSLAIVAVLALLLVVGKVTGLGGEHGPGRHGGGGETELEQDGGHRPPVDH